MRKLALIAALALSACSNETEPESAFPITAGLYSVDGGAISCPGAAVEILTDRVDCEWTCLDIDGRDVRWVTLTFLRDDATSPWREPVASWDFNGFAETCGVTAGP